MKLREIQKEALTAIMNSFKAGTQFTLIQASTGFGKTVMFSELIKVARQKYDVKCLVLAHQKELVEQAKAKLVKVAPELATEIRLFCASTGASKEEGLITIGSIQSLNNAPKIDKYNLVIIDEVHRLANKKTDSMYKKLLKRLLESNSRLRVLGVTATPYRLGEGYIYGGEHSWFKELAFSTDLDEMIEMGYLCDYRYKVADYSGASEAADKIGKGGADFHNDLLGEEMSEEIHLGSVEKAIEEHAKDRKKILVFAVNVKHAEKLAERLGCNCLHHGKKNREEIIEAFTDGDERILVNVEMMTTGFDFPDVDCIIQARPTLSPALMVQLCGRGLRLKQSGRDCLILDLVGNYIRHGNLADPIVKTKKADAEEDRKKKEREANICEECFELVEAGLDFCSYCGASMEKRKQIIEINRKQELIEIERSRSSDVISSVNVNYDYKTKKGAYGIQCVAFLRSGRRAFHFYSYNYSRNLEKAKKFEQLKCGEKVNLEKTEYGLKIKGFIR